MTTDAAAPSRIPVAAPAVLPVATTCVLVLDLTPRPDLERPDAVQFLQRVGGFLDRARASGVPVLFTASLSEKGKEVATALGRREDEPLFHPDAFDKLRSPELQAALDARGCTDLVVTGAAVNHSVMNTVIGAARHFPYSVHVPLDGVHSTDPYAYEYALFHLSHLPRSARPPHFTTLDTIAFSG